MLPLIRRVSHALLATALLASCPGKSQDGMKDGVAVLVGEEARQMITQQHGCRDTPEFDNGDWKPAGQEVAAAERALSTSLNDARNPRMLGEYVRQYAGFFRKGKRVIYVNAAVRDFLASGDAWRDKAFLLIHGGRNAFGAVYDVQSGQVDSFVFNRE